MSRTWRVLRTRNVVPVIQRRLGQAHGSRRLLFREPLDTDTRVPKIINSLIRLQHPPISYLEIGVFRGATIENVSAAVRTGVDPSPLFSTKHLPRGVLIHTTTSDRYFATEPAIEIDFAYIDGAHTFEQSYRDFRNTARYLKPNGMILFDDTVPQDSWAAIPDEQESHRARHAATGVPTGPHQGDVWKTILAIARFHPEFEIASLSGPGRHRTLVYPRTPRTNVGDPLAERPTIDVSFEDAFQGGVPNEFRLTTLRELTDRLRRSPRAVPGESPIRLQYPR